MLGRSAAFSLYGLLAAIIAMPCTVFAVDAGQIDDFENGTVQTWQKGLRSTNPPTNISSGGPSGTNDNYLQTVSNAGISADSKQVIFNNVQWTGDYLAAGIIEIGMQFRNSGSSMLHMRIALEGGPTTRSWFGSSQAFEVPADGNWYEIGRSVN